jgi:hypothetical protein
MKGESMKDRDRLIELLQQADAICSSRKQCEGCVGFGKGSDCVDHHMADYLLANGVIVPPVKVGDTVYYINGAYYNSTRQTVKPIEVTEISWKCDRSGRDLGFALIAHGTRYKFSSIGKTVFLSKEEAEAKLKELV